MILTQELLHYIAKQVMKQDRVEARSDDYDRWKMFNGSTATIIKNAIAKEYAKKETVEELSGRLIPINFMCKIIVKLAGVYIEAPIRQAEDRSAADQELMDEFTQEMCLNQRMKEANRYFKLFKRNLMELYVDEYGTPYARNLPRHTYEVFSFSSLTPNRPDVVVKILTSDTMLSKVRLSVWSSESSVITDGEGTILQVDSNPSGVNPYGVLPFVYINESSYSCDPLPDDDLMRMSIALPVILTDICWATKYQSNSILYTIGDVGTIPSAPNSVVAMGYGPEGQKPEIGQIKPEVDTDKVISMVQTLVALLLSTKNLSVNAIQSQLNVGNVASGISKMLDSAESVEDKKDQQEYFFKAEKHLWTILKDNLIPVWRQQNLLKPDLNKNFSDNFEVNIYFTEPKVMISEKEQIEISKLRLESGFSTLEMELKAIYPQLHQQQIEELVVEIEEYNAAKSQGVVDSIDGTVNPNEVEDGEIQAV